MDKQCVYDFLKIVLNLLFTHWRKKGSKIFTFNEKTQNKMKIRSSICTFLLCLNASIIVFIIMF